MPKGKVNKDLVHWAIASWLANIVMALPLIMLYPQNAEVLVAPAALAAPRHTGEKRKGISHV
jgi:hypothetical protein